MNEHPLNALPQGYRLQEYEFVRVLGFGGFGVTYLGYDHNLDKAVAIKEYQPADIAIRTENQSIAPKASTFREDFDWGLERFLDEARTLARFDHRNIVKVHRYFEANGTAYIVMEYVEGETLSAYLTQKGTLDEAELKRVLMPILDGLETIHGADFLHRDIKPGNIVLRDEDTSPVLVDFGAARHAVSARSHSVTTIVTPGYAPIEQYSSKGNQGPWTDIYALGAVFYKALTGESPSDAIDRLERDPFEPAAKRCSSKGGRGFLKAVDWALKVKEGDRPQTIAAWKSAVLTAEPMPAKEIPPPKSDLQPPSTQRKLTRSHWIVVILFLSVVTSGIVIAIQQELEQKSEEARRIAAVEAREARRASVEAFRQSQTRAAEEARRAAAERERRAQVAEEVRKAAVEAERQRQVRAAEEERRATAEAERQASTATPVVDVSTDLAAAEAERARQAQAAEQIVESTNRQSTDLDSFTRGSHKDDVLRLQGTPDNITSYSSLGHEVWRYGSSTVEINLRTGKVMVWNNRGNLKVELRPGRGGTESPRFTRGSHKDDVLRLQGTPDNITSYSSLGHEVWRYGSSTVEINLRTGKVMVWNNRGNLKVELRPGRGGTESPRFTRGSHKDDVLRLQGTPDNITSYSSLGHEVWRYGSSTVEINLRTGKVMVWNNRGNLKVELRPGRGGTESPRFTRGSHKDDVLRLQGTPDNITSYSSLGHEVWRYGSSTVEINLRTGKVMEWSNRGNLKVQMK